MDNELGSRLFGFIGAGATLGQLFGSLFATGMAFIGPFLLLLAALLMELAAQASRGISHGTSDVDEELFPIRESDSNHEIEKTEHTLRSSPESSTSLVKHKIWPIFEGLWLILSSTYLLHISLLIWLSAVVSSFFYFQNHLLELQKKKVHRYVIFKIDEKKKEVVVEKLDTLLRVMMISPHL